MKCLSRIVKFPKKGKASQIMFPESMGSYPSDCVRVEEAFKFPQCKGTVSVTIDASIDWGYYEGDAASQLNIKYSCTHCRHPYFRGKFELDYATELTFEQIKRIMNENQN